MTLAADIRRGLSQRLELVRRQRKLSEIITRYIFLLRRQFDGAAILSLM